jgi:hypothetical protein
MPAQTSFLDPTSFNTAAAAWTDAVSKEGSLSPFFLNYPNSYISPTTVPVEKLQYVTFSVNDMVALVSTVGVRYIRAQFVLLPPAEGVVRFTVVLYALDSQRGRISAYYAGATGAMVPGALPATPDSPNAGGELPVDLVQSWIGAWQNLTDISPDMFDTNYGPLQGYIFNLQDFIDPLFPSYLTSGYELRVYLGLHSYNITSANITTPDTTVGLVISVQPESTPRLPINYLLNKNKLVSNNANDGDDSGYYDLSHPSPPGVPPMSV